LYVELRVELRVEPRAKLRAELRAELRVELRAQNTMYGLALLGGLYQGLLWRVLNLI